MIIVTVVPFLPSSDIVAPRFSIIAFTTDSPELDETDISIFSGKPDPLSLIVR